jgi:serine/threonine protein kinase
MSSVNNEADDVDVRHPVEILAEEFASRLRLGEHPSIEEYASKHPELADLIRSVFPPIALVERVSRSDSSSKGSSSLNHASRSGRMPDTLGDYKVVREIGRGGMGIVYEAVQQSLQRHVALKVISSDVSGNEKHRNRFRREAEAAASLHHTNIVPIYGIGEDHGVQYYAMQLIDGVPLSDVIESIRNLCERPKPSNPESNRTRSLSSVAYSAHETRISFSSAQAAHWFFSSSRIDTPVRPIPFQPNEIETSQKQPTGANEQPTAPKTRVADAATVECMEPDHPISTESDDLPANRNNTSTQAWLTRDYFRNVAKTMANAANAIDYAHRQKILHRDIKPANLLLDREGTVWITDFGLARRMDLEGATQTGEVLGTLRYMAPEQISGEGDSRVDIYSLGLTLFELLTLRPAIESPKRRLLDPSRNSNIPNPRHIQPNVPRDLETITLKACAYASQDRYQTAGEMEADLHRFLEDRPILAKKTTAWESLVRWSRRNPAIASLAAVASSMLLCIAGLLFVWNRQQNAAIHEISTQFNRAERNLLEKSDALESVRKEQTRAEANLQLALQAFDKIADNIAARGKTYSANSNLDSEDAIDLSGAALSQADVALLESLLEFFDRFGLQNEKDLRMQTARALKRVGDIQQRIGQLEEADQSYRKALAAFQSLPDSLDVAESTLTIVSIYNELIVVNAKQGQWQDLANMYGQARSQLESHPDVAQSPEGRFVLAKLLNSIATLSARVRPGNIRPSAAIGPNVRSLVNSGLSNTPNDPRNLGTQLPPAPIKGIAPLNFPRPILGGGPNSRWKQEADLNTEALRILNDLVLEDPTKVSYRTVLARVLRDQSRIERALGDLQHSEKSLMKSVSILEELIQANPESPLFQFELAETLSTGTGNRSDLQRSNRALNLCDELLKNSPDVPEYLALKATILFRLGAQNRNAPRNHWIDEKLQEALKIQRGLAQRYSDIPIYSVQVMQTLMLLAEIEKTRDHPIKAKEYQAEARALLDSLIERNKANGRMFRPLIEQWRERLSSSDSNE